MSDCLFCKIAVREIFCHKVYENGSVLAFLDIHPCSKGHTVVIPKQHATELRDMDHKSWSALMDGLKSTIELVDSKLSPAGFNIGINNREAAGQAVLHVHWHIIPRYQNDGGGNMHSIVRSTNPGDVAQVAKLFQ